MDHQSSAGKLAVREKFLEKRLSFPAAEKKSADAALNIHLEKLLSDLGSRGVMAFRPLKSEADPFLGEVNSNWFYPRVSGSDIEPCRIKSSEHFVTSKLGVSEPKSSVRAVASHKMKLVLVPGVAFDHHGNRLGLGKGFYDRFLKKLPRETQRVGVAYSFQVSRERLPKEEWDERVDWIVTDRFILNVERKD